MMIDDGQVIGYPLKSKYTIQGWCHITMDKLSRLNELLQYAKENNAFYESLYQGLEMPVSDTRNIPILHRRDIRKNKYGIISKPYTLEGLMHDKTNGTTEKIPLDIYRTEYEWIKSNMDLWKKRRSVSKRHSSKYAFYYYNGNDHSLSHKNFSNGNYKAFHFPMMKQGVCQFANDLYMMKKENIKWVIAPPSILFTLACVALQHEIDIEIPIIESISEYLPHQYISLFEKVFRSKVYDNYGCHEVWGIAYSDSNGELRVMENVIVEELVDDRFLNGFKRCIVTNLTVKSMPFIRYELSDLIKVNGDVLQTYGFRWNEYVQLDNTNIHCSVFMNIFENFDAIRLLPLENYQLIYKEDGIVLILMNVEKYLHNYIREHLERNLAEIYRKTISVSVLASKRFLVDTVSGKMRGIVNYYDVNVNEEFNLGMEY